MTRQKKESANFKTFKITRKRSKKKKMKKGRGTSGTPSSGTMYTLWESQKEKKKRGTESLFEEIMTKFTKSEESNGQIQESQRTPSRINTETYTETHHNQTIKSHRENLESSRRKANLSCT